MSTNTALASIIEGIQNKLDQGEYAADIFVDLTKAFDTVDHDILIHKLKHYGVRGVTKECFYSYLINRKKFVSNDGFVSNTKHISTGIPQGSVLRLMLFLIYINDLHTYVKYSKTYHFANDTNILYSNKSLEILVKNINHDLKRDSLKLKANKFPIISHPHTKELDHPLKFKLNGKRLIPVHSVN